MIPRATLLLSFLFTFAQGKNLRSRDNSECGSLSRCVLQNLSTNQEIPLNLHSKTSYTLLDNSQPYSIRCETEGQLNKLTFHYSGDNSHQHELWKAPYWMNGVNDDNSIPAEPFLSSCGTKTIRVVGEVWAHPCFEEPLELEADCSGTDSTTTTACNFTCPLNSEPNLSSSSCTNSLSDCQCRYGYKMVSGYCVKDWCYHDFTCPQGMERLTGKDCYTSRRDCQWKPMVGR